MMIGVIIPNIQLAIGITARDIGCMFPSGGINDSMIPLQANPKKNTIKPSFIKNENEVIWYPNNSRFGTISKCFSLESDPNKYSYCLGAVFATILPTIMPKINGIEYCLNHESNFLRSIESEAKLQDTS